MNTSNRNSRTISLFTVFIGMMLTVGSTNADDHNQGIGLVVGAAVGGLLGSQLGDADYDNRRHYRDNNNRHWKARNHEHRKHKYHRNNGRKYGHSRYHRRDYFNRRYSYPDYYRSYRRDYNRHYSYPRNYYRDYSSRRYYRGGGNTTQLIATATGVFFGALIGSEIGRYMDDVDRMQARQANLQAQAAPIGTRVSWNNPRTNNYGSVTATRDGYGESGRYCREFYQTVSIGGRTEDAYGVACRQPDGAWQIVQPLN